MSTSPPRTLRTRLLLYLYGTPNIVGCALALVGPALLFAGVIGPLWLPITAALYALGVLVAPRQPMIAAGLAQEMSSEAMLEQLDRVIRDARPHLQPEMLAHLDSIRAAVAEVLPRLRGGSAGNALFTVRETALRYLPETLSHYVALPAAFRVSHPLRDGGTARDVLNGQLRMLDEQMQQVVANVASGDAQALLANGRFLESRFQRHDFLDARQPPAAP